MSSRLSLGMFPFLARTCISPTCLSFGRRPSLQLILFLAPFVSTLSRILLVTFLMSFSSVLSALFVFVFPGLPLFLLVLALCLSPLVLLRALCPRMLSASFCGTSFLMPTLPPLWPLPLAGLLLLPPLLSCLLLFGRTVFGWLLLLRPFLVTLHFLLSWLLPLGLLPRFLRLSTCGMFSSPLLMVLVWVLWWRQVMSFDWLWLCIYVFLYIFVY